MLDRTHWAPVGVLLIGAALLTGVQAQTRPELRQPLAEALPHAVRDWDGVDLRVPEAEAEVAGFTDYAMRVYASPDTTDGRWASVYVGFYDQQTRGRTIHSPKNCLPGAGWEALSSSTQPIEVGGETIRVNRYVLQNGDQRALVLYWYQGRGRVAHNEYLVKVDLLRDAALKRRTDEALVRIVVPFDGSEEDAFSLAKEIAADVKPRMDEALPA